jgi:hypothetical protein
MKFYRGDSIPNQVQGVARNERGRTFADHFCGNGLMAKFADGGSSRLLHGKDLLDMILSHVGYEHDQPEKLFSYRSPFLSFTQDSGAAFGFAKRTGKKDLEECLLEDASHFVWELDIDLPNEVEPGRYEFSYKASSENYASLVAEQIQRGLEQEALTGNAHDLVKGIMNLTAIYHAEADPRNHRAELIDVVRYVQSHNTISRDSRLVSNTLERAYRSREWLLYPTDPMEDGPGLSYRFATNRHLRVYRCYRVRSEPTGI